MKCTDSFAPVGDTSRNAFKRVVHTAGLSQALKKEKMTFFVPRITWPPKQAINHHIACDGEDREPVPSHGARFHPGLFILWLSHFGYGFMLGGGTVLHIYLAAVSQPF